MDNMMPGDNSGAEPEEMDICPDCEGSGLDLDSEVQGARCGRCEGSGLIAPDPDDYDEPWYTEDDL